MGLILLIARLDAVAIFVSLLLSSRVKRGICISELQIPRFARNDNWERESLKANASYVPQQVFSGTHKNYSLVDCPIYSVVKYRPLEPGSQL